MSLGIYSGCENFLIENSFSMWLCNKDVVGARSTKERGNIRLWLELVAGTRSMKEMKGKIFSYGWSWIDEGNERENIWVEKQRHFSLTIHITTQTQLHRQRKWEIFGKEKWRRFWL